MSNKQQFECKRQEDIPDHADLQMCVCDAIVLLRQVHTLWQDCASPAMSHGLPNKLMWFESTRGNLLLASLHL